VPVVHDHSLDLKSLAHNCQLAEHVFAYHADGLGHEDTGLHFHFMLLDQSTNSLLADSGPNGQHDGGAVDTILKLEQQHLRVLDLNSAWLQSNPSDALCVAEDLRFSATANASFLQTRLFGSPAFAVLCVCLC
jgi:hypothetical protein